MVVIKNPVKSILVPLAVGSLMVIPGCKKAAEELTPSKTDLDKAVFLAEAMRAVKSGKKRLIIDIDTSNDGYGRG